jgi:hypothetical protein
LRLDCGIFSALRERVWRSSMVLVLSRLLRMRIRLSEVLWELSFGASSEIKGLWWSLFVDEDMVTSVLYDSVGYET